MENKKILNGKGVRDLLAGALKKKVASYKSIPNLVILSLSQDERSDTYVKQKILFGEKIGVRVSHVTLPLRTEEKDVMSKVCEYNKDPEVHGIIIQLPLPDHISAGVVKFIDPKKDVDGLHPENLGSLVRKEGGFTPATVRGVHELLNAYQIPVSRKRVVVVGRSALVGTPLALSFMHKDATVTIAHSHTKNLKDITNQADILCVAIGKPHFIGREYVREGQVVIDIGINVRASDQGNTLVGDVSFEEVYDKVSYITPVPGGVGPMTVYALFANLCDAYERSFSGGV